MKRFLLSLTILLAAVALTACSQKAKWNHEQKKAMRENLRQYRDMIYLQDLTDPEFLIFSDSVTGDIEAIYPVYTTFIEMDGAQDTVDMFVFTIYTAMSSLSISNSDTFSHILVILFGLPNSHTR